MAQELRKYRYGDADMLQDANTMLEIYSDNETWFTGFNSSIFHEEYKTGFRTAIDAARRSIRDGLIKDELAERTARLEELMEKCRSHYRLIRFLAERAFPGNRTIHAQFGFGSYKGARRFHEKMKLFLDVLVCVIEKYESQLLEAGAPADLRDATAALAEELGRAKTEQQGFIKYRPGVTDARINLLNAVWERMRDINAAARIIFEDDATKLKLFEMRNETGKVK